MLRLAPEAPIRPVPTPAGHAPRLGVAHRYVPALCALGLVLGLPLAAATASSDAPPFATSWSVGVHDEAILATDLAHLQALDGEDTHLVWIGLTDKGIRSDAGFRRALNEVEVALGDASRARRLRAGGAWIVDYLDIPVPETYVEALRATRVEVRVVSRWLGAISVDATREQLTRVAALPFVSRITPVARGRRIAPPAPVEPTTSSSSSGLLPLDYGPSQAQLDQIQVSDLHALGYTGAGVIVCMLDTGYFKDHQSFDAIRTSGRLLDEWDFINNDGNTQNEPGDNENQHNHGTYTWSALGGEWAGELYGPAYGATFLLGKTEDVTDEQPIEEDWYVAGLEWADLLGAQVVSSSLAYKDWYTYEDMDGETAVTTNGVDIAASRNILVCTAAGNEGNSEWHYIMAPADADSALACGAVDENGEMAGFSGWGPSYDGRTKPEVCARGVQTHCAVPGGGGDEYGDASGTSLSTPLVGGVAALIFEAQSSWTAMEVREAMMATADSAATPNNHRGWGVLRALDASNYPFTGIAFDAAPRPGLLLRASPNPLGSAGAIDLTVPGADSRRVRVRLYDVTGRLRGVILDRELPPGTHRIGWTGRDNADQRLVPGVYFLRAAIGADVAVSRVVVSP